MKRYRLAFGVAAFFQCILVAPASGQQDAWQEEREFLNPAGLPTATKWAWGDLDGDGATEVITLSWAYDVCCILDIFTESKGTAPPNWQRHDELTAEIAPLLNSLFVAIVDIKGDRLPEIISDSLHPQNHERRLVVLHRDSTGKWQQDWEALADIPWQGEAWSENLSFADVEQDGDADLLVGTPSYNFGEVGLRFFENTGTPAQPFWREDSSKLAQVYENPVGYSTYSPVLLDIDRDGIIDILLPHVIEGLQDVVFYRGAMDSTGIFWLAPAKRLSLPYISRLQSPVAFDFDKDGLPDLLDTADARLFLASEDSLYFRRESYSLNLLSTGGELVLPANFQQNGNPEILVIRKEFGGFVDFLAFTLYELDQRFGWGMWRVVSRFRQPLEPRADQSLSGQIVDLDRNGVPEVVGSFDVSYDATRSRFFVYEYTEPSEQQTWHEKSYLLQQFKAANARKDSIYALPVFVDLDRDQDSDLLIRRKIHTGQDSGKSEYVFFENRLDADSIRWIERLEWRSAFPDTAFFRAAFADLDKDGDADLVLGMPMGALLYYENLGRPGAPMWVRRDGVLPEVEYAWYLYPEGTYPSPVFADVDNDGDDDLLVLNGFADHHFFRNRTIVGLGRAASVPPGRFYLQQNYPNPFNRGTMIEYAVPVAGLVTLEIIDLAGRTVRTLVHEKQQAGHYRITFDGAELASGLYLYRLKMASLRQTRKLLLLR